MDEARLAEIQGQVSTVDKVGQSLHMCVYGQQKTGKTRFACSGPKPILFMAEPGMMTVRDIPDLQLFPVDKKGKPQKVTWANAYDFLYYLKYGDHDRKTVVIDTVTALARTCMRYILKDEESRDTERMPNNPTMQSWGRLGQSMNEFMEELSATCRTKGMNLIYVAQERYLKEDKDFTGPDIVPDVSPSIRSTLCEMPDIIARTFVEEGDIPAGAPIDTTPDVRYGMEFRSARALVGERLTTGDDPVLPNMAYNVTVPKILSKLGGK